MKDPTHTKLRDLALVGFLDPKYDDALLGWTKRQDLAPTAAYNDEALPTDVPVNGALKVMRFPRIQFWKFVEEQGMITWKHLTPAVIGVVKVNGLPVVAYNWDAAVEELAAALDDGTEVDVEARLEELAALDAGPQTPVFVRGGRRSHAINNGLGFSLRQRPLPVFSHSVVAIEGAIPDEKEKVHAPDEPARA